MKIGIIVHSHTGNTLSVAERIKEQLTASGHNVTMEKVLALKDDEPQYANVKFENKPGIEGYDVVFFGCPVRGFSVSPIMHAYLEQLSGLQEKKIICFLTQQFPWKWAGGNHTLRQMDRICSSKGGKVIGLGGINWSRKTRDQDIIELVNHFCNLINRLS